MLVPTRIDERTALELSHDWDVLSGKPRLRALGVLLARPLQVKVFEQLYPNAASVDEAASWRNRLKRVGLDWRAKFLYSKFAATQEASSQVVWAVYDVNNKSCTDVLNAVCCKLDKPGSRVSAICLEPAIERRVVSSLSRLTWTLCFGWKDQIKAMRESRKLRQEFRRNRGEYLLKMVRAGVPGSLAEKILRRIYVQIPDIVREVICLEGLFGRFKPEVLLLSNDAHRIPRIMTTLAREREIPVVSLQHGLPVWQYGYVPVFADLVLVWGATSEEWFRSHGVSADRIKRVGDPRKAGSKLKVPVAAELGEIDRLVWMPNPVGRDLIEIMSATFFEVADSFDLPLVIKLHPSEQDDVWYDSLVPLRHSARTTITNCPTEDLNLGAGDVVVVGNSTVGVDAVACGSFVVNLRHSALPNPINYEEYGVGITVHCEAASDAGVASKIRSLALRPRAECRTRFLDRVYEGTGAADVRAAGVIECVMAEAKQHVDGGQKKATMKEED